MPRKSEPSLSRRERQIMDAVYRRGRATAAEVLEDLPEPPTYSAVRTMLGRLHEKGHLAVEQDGPRYVYLPTIPRDRAQTSAMDQLLRTFFGGSPGKAMAALLDRHSTRLSDDELETLSEMIEQAKKGDR